MNDAVSGARKLAVAALLAPSLLLSGGCWQVRLPWFAGQAEKRDVRSANAYQNAERWPEEGVRLESLTYVTLPEQSTGDTAAIDGVVKYSGPDPDTRIRMDADPACASQHGDPVFTETIVVDRAGNLSNVFVYVKEGLSRLDFPAPTERLFLEQVGCLFRPRILGIRAGQKLVLRNGDDTMHSIQALAGINRGFTVVQPFKGMFIEKTFDRPEIAIRLKCQFHPWMVAYVSVVNHPFFAVSGGDGRFSISRLPPGNYLLEAWHEILGTQTQGVRLKANEVAKVGFDFAPRN